MRILVVDSAGDVLESLSIVDEIDAIDNLEDDALDNAEMSCAVLESISPVLMKYISKCVDEA